MDGRIFESYIDTEDLQKILDMGFSWSPTYYKCINGYYIKASVKQEGGSNKSYYLHRVILNVEGRRIIVHHKDGNTLNNKKENLEVTTIAVNSQLRNRVNSNSSTGVRNVNRSNNPDILWVQFMKNGEVFKWEFPTSQFDEACEFARLKRIELYGKE